MNVKDALIAAKTWDTFHLDYSDGKNIDPNDLIKSRDIKLQLDSFGYLLLQEGIIDLLSWAFSNLNKNDPSYKGKKKEIYNILMKIKNKKIRP